jgi:multidrug efflux pump
MMPLSSVVKAKWGHGAAGAARYNGYAAVEIVGNAAPGYSTGQAMQACKTSSSRTCRGFGSDWTGQSYQEILAGNSATMLMLLSIVIVFLCLSALYESWSIPVSPCCWWCRWACWAWWCSASCAGMPNDIYFKIGMVTVIGLAAKNAILIVEFAVEEQAAGKTLFERGARPQPAALAPDPDDLDGLHPGRVPAGHLHRRGANSRHEIGTGVIGGMLFATFLGLLLIPVFYVSVRRLLGDKLDGDGKDQPVSNEPKSLSPPEADPYRGG